MPKRYAYLWLFIFVSVSLIAVNQSANVLCMFTSSGKSQLVIFMAVANVLIERGHNVTVITTIPLPPSNKKKPFRHILLAQPKETLQTLRDNIISMAEEKASKLQSMMNFMTAVNLFTNIQMDALEQEQFQSFLKEDNHFDLMLLGYFNNDFLVGVAARYKCPVAVISLGTPYGPISRMVGNPEETSYILYTLFGRSQPTGFSDRLINFLWAIAEPFVDIYAQRMMESYYNRLFTADFYPKYSDVITNISLVLCNKHFTEMPIQPLVPALIEIGGVHIEENPGPVPEDIQAFLDSATNGAILYCVGQKTPGAYLMPYQIKIVFKVLSQLDQKVLWEWDNPEPPPRTSSNIYFTRWLHHEYILSHPNVKAYITDVRLTSMFAAQYYGVPMVGMPIYAEQPYNIEEVVTKGFGVWVEPKTLTEAALRDGIAEVLNNPYYTQKVKHFSNIYRDRPTTARETAGFWLEYVIRHRGAPHMQSPLVRMGFVKRWNLDLITVLVAVTFALKKLIKIVVFLARRSLDFKIDRREKITKFKHL